MVLLIDDETRTYWDHITGKAVHGKLAGAQLEVWAAPMTTVAAALARDGDVELSRSHPALFKRMFGHVMHSLANIVKLPAKFRGTMGEADTRLPEWTHGLGVIDGDQARYYPMKSIGEGIEEDWAGRTIRIAVDEVDNIPFAQWDDGTRPMQLLSRWYGFSYTYPATTIFAVR